MRHLCNMPEDSGSRYKFPVFKINEGNELIEKPEKLSFLSELLEISQKKRGSN